MLRFVRILAFVLPGVLVAASGTLTRTFEFNQDDLVFGKVNDYDAVTLVGANGGQSPFAAGYST